MPNTIRILALDGGGTRGVLPATILNRLQQDLGGSILDKFDLVAGTSTGGILGVGLTYGKTPEEMVNLYLKHAEDIFHDSVWDDLGDLLDLRGAEYNQIRFKKILRKFFKSHTLSTIRERLNDGIDQNTESKKQLMVCAFELNPEDSDGKEVNYKPKVFNSDFVRDQNESLVDLCLKTSAGPTYFPIYDGFVDGGVTMNNPSMAAIAYAINGHKDNKKKYRYPDGIKKGLGSNLNNIKLLSLGTGTSNLNRISDKQIGNGDWGLWKWKNHIANMLTETNIAATDYYVSNILKQEQRMRIQVNFQDYKQSVLYKELIKKGKPVGLDVKEEKYLKAMEDIANKVYDKQRDKLLAYIDVF